MLVIKVWEVVTTMYQYTLLLMLLQFCFFFSKVNSRELPNNYTKGTDGNHYKYIADEAKWIDASKKCNEEGAHLAIDDSRVVHNYLINTYPSLHFWIGVNELAAEGTWRYNDGRKVVTSYWDDKQPGNDKKHDDCVAMGESGRWHDDACTLRKSFLCQIKEIPDGYTKGVDGNYFKYFSNLTNWHDANSRCNGDDAHLAVVDSDDIHKYLIKTYPTLKYWIGVNALDVKDTWMFSDGRRVKKGYWEFGHPKNERGDCVAMWNSERWHVDDCSEKRSFVCQMTVNDYHLVELMNEMIQNNGFTAPVIMGVIVLVIFLFIIWCIFKHKKTRKIPKASRNKAQRRTSSQQVNSNQQPRFVINLNDTITINPNGGGSKPISTIHKSVVFASASDTTVHHYPVYNQDERISLPQGFDNHAFMHGQDYPPPSYYSLSS